MIRQERCAMKVGTDGVILGAWTSARMPGKNPGTPGMIPGADNDAGAPGMKGRALDVGTGTGLLALMLAQRWPELEIDAIELDAAAAQQAAENVAASDFGSRIRVQHADFRDFDPGPGVNYDLVICNPPYFNRSRKAAGAGRSMARHSDTLDLERLFSGAVKILNATGTLSIIFPSDQFVSARELAGKHGLFPARILEIRPVPGAAPMRHCVQFWRRKGTPAMRSIVIEDHGRHGYSDAYRELTKAFYLDL